MKTTYTFDDIQIVPKYSEVVSRSVCNLETQFTKNYKIKIPIVSSPMDTVTSGTMAMEIAKLGGVGIIHRFMSIENQVAAVKVVKSYLSLMISIDSETESKLIWNCSLDEIPIAAAVGANPEHYVKRAKALVEAGANVLLIDVAHGHHKNVELAINGLRKIVPSYVDIIAGNVATEEGALFLIKAGADAIRVGIGNGSLCETRIRTGIGVPQVSALLNCNGKIKNWKIPMISDGGIKQPGDAAKALYLGANSIMLGSLLSGTRESPGEIQKEGAWPNEKLFKKYRGSASRDAKLDSGMEDKNIEGNSKLVPYKGKIKRIIGDINDGIRSSMSYVNCYNLKDFKYKDLDSDIILVTESGKIEAKPHLML